MYPYFFGNKNLDSFMIMIVISLFSAVIMFRFLCNKTKVADKPYNFYAMVGIISMVAGLISSFLFQQLYNIIDSIQTGKPYEAKGVTFLGGLVGGVVTFLLLTAFVAKPEIKDEFYPIANLTAPCIVVAHFFGRIGCTMAGCCYGKHTDSFIGIVFNERIGKVIPTQLIEAIFLFVLLCALLLLIFKFNKKDILLIVYGYSYSVFRFIIEFFRGDERGELAPLFSPSQWQSIILLIVTTILTVAIYKYKIIPFKSKPKKENQIVSEN